MRDVSEKEGQLSLAKISITFIAELGELGCSLQEGMIVVELVAHWE